MREARKHAGAVDWNWYLYRDIEASVPALDLSGGIFIAEALDHLTQSRRAFQESSAEVALLAAGLDRDRAIFLEVAIPLCPGAGHGQEPEGFVVGDEPHGYRNRAAGAAADDGYGDLAALLQRLGR